MSEPDDTLLSELSCVSSNEADRKRSLTRSNMKKLTLVLVSSMAVLLSACGGGGAVDDGALTQDEYNKEKSKILSEAN